MHRIHLTYPRRPEAFAVCKTDAAAAGLSQATAEVAHLSVLASIKVRRQVVRNKMKLNKGVKLILYLGNSRGMQVTAEVARPSDLASQYQGDIFY